MSGFCVGIRTGARSMLWPMSRDLTCVLLWFPRGVSNGNCCFLRFVRVCRILRFRLYFFLFLNCSRLNWSGSSDFLVPALLIFLFLFEPFLPAALFQVFTTAGLFPSFLPVAPFRVFTTSRVFDLACPLAAMLFLPSAPFRVFTKSAVCPLFLLGAPFRVFTPPSLFRHKFSLFFFLFFLDLWITAAARGRESVVAGQWQSFSPYPELPW